MTQSLPKTDGQLLVQFTADHSQAAFTELVNRHGAMVHGVALRVLADHHAAQDVTQAAFLALARKASALRRSESVGGWLHTVAWRLAIDVQRSRRSRQQREETAMRDQPTVTAAAQPEAGLFRAELDAALHDLPERYRQPLVLFHLEGQSLEQTSQAMGLNLNTLSTRLARARELLRKKLVARGLSIGSVGALTALLSAESGAASLPATFVAATVQSATATSMAGTVATTTIVLGGILVNTKLIVAGTLVVVIIGSGLYFTSRNPEPVPVAAARPAPVTSPAVKIPPPTSTPTLSVTTEPRPPEPVPDDPLAKITSLTELEAMLEQTLLIADDVERLQALRQRLGINLPDDVYRKALTAHANRSSTKKLFQAILLAWTESDPHAALLWTQRLPGEAKTGFSRGLLSYWMERDQEAALAFAQEHFSPEVIAAAEARLANRQASDVTQLVSQGKFMELIRRAEAETDPAVRDANLRLAIDKWAEKEPRAAADYALALPREGLTRETSVNSVFRAWANVDPDAAVAFAKSLTNETDRVQALTTVLPGWARKHPEQEVDVSFLPLNKQKLVVRQVAEEWAMRNPAGAMQYALGLDDASLRNLTVASVAGMWAKKDPAAARQWIATLPAGESRDAGLQAMAHVIGAYDLAQAESLANDIQDAASRNSTVEGLITLGLRHDPARAVQLANQLPEVDYLQVSMWMMQARNREAIDALRTWVETAQTAGRIKYPTYHNPDGVDPAVVKAWEQRAAADGYQFILDGLTRAEKEAK